MSIVLRYGSIISHNRFVEDLTNKKYKSKTGAFWVIADHVGLLLLISDGVFRKRRASYILNMLLEEPFVMGKN